MKIEIEIEQGGQKKIFTKEFTTGETAGTSFTVLTLETVEQAKREVNFQEAGETNSQKEYMPGYYDSEGNSYDLKERLGTGGEGKVYLLENSDLVAKIYHETVTPEKSEKLRWMAAHKNEQLLKVSAWVEDVLRDKPDGKIVGFLMQNIKAKEIHELYSLKSRRVHFPEATWHFLVHAAANVARAFYNLHKNNHVMGDVNHGNCVVLADGTVKLIDCDSYSVKTDKMRYPCEVGVATHLAPELQGVNLSRVERLDKHDNFGLAVIIFQLLFLGRHPFAGNYLGAEDKSIEECIRELRFAYGSNAKLKNVAQPPGTLPLEAVSPRVALMFERAFLTEDRPEPREWIEALEDLANNLEQCSEHPGHIFYKENVLCPWCEIEMETGVMLFPFVMSDVYLKNKNDKSFDIVTVENLVASLDIKSVLPDKLRENTVLANSYVLPSPEIVKENSEQRRQQLLLIGIYFAAFCYVTFAFGGCAVVLGIVATIILYTRFGDTGKMIRVEARDRLTKVQQKWLKLENDWTRFLASSDLDKNLAQIDGKINDYRQLERGKYRKEAVGVQKTNFVEKIQAQFDVEYTAEITAKRETLEREITNLLPVLRVSSVRVSKYQRQLQTQSQTLARELVQSESNVRFLGSNLPVGIILILITVGISIFGSIVHQNFAPNLTTVSSVPPPNKAGQFSALATVAEPKMNVFIPEENITDREIEKFSASERADIAGGLLNQANLSLADVDYAKAEKKLKFALRFDPKNARVISKIGFIFYNQGKYSQSLDYFNRAAAITDDDDETNFYIGMNYLQMKNYSAARDVFVKLTGGTMKNNEGFYNLGLAYQGLKDYSAAVAAFQKALNFNPNDLDSTYEMGICFSKIGDREQVLRFYQALLEKDGNRAAQFKKAVGKSFNLELPPVTITVK
ncbi:MAG: tetratricopeptide repeat protein [Pyrinomonadaceae bacterium]